MREALAPGVIAGYPVVDVRVIVYDGKHHSVDSKEIAFVTAGRKAFMAAVREARPIVLEPIVNVEIRAPDRRWATSPATCRRKRGQVSGTHNGAAGTMRRARPGAAGRAGGLPVAAQRDDQRPGPLHAGALALRAGAAEHAAAARRQYKVRDDD